MNDVESVNSVLTKLQDENKKLKADLSAARKAIGDALPYLFGRDAALFDRARPSATGRMRTTGAPARQPRENAMTENQAPNGAAVPCISLLAADRIDSLLSDRGGCMCGRGESCEECFSFSGLNKLREQLRHLAADLRGKPIQPPTLEDYGRSITIPQSALTANIGGEGRELCERTSPPPCSAWRSGLVPARLHGFPLLAVVRSTVDERLRPCAVLVQWDDACSQWLHLWNATPLPPNCVVERWAVVNMPNKKPTGPSVAADCSEPSEEVCRVCGRRSAGPICGRCIREQRGA